MRGKLCLNQQVQHRERNIPAYAGKTCPILAKASFTPEHPRVCGENRVPVMMCTVLRGTSPRMRGKPFAWSARIFGERNIPAYAGKTRYANICWLTPKEHPRVCGENSSQLRLPNPQRGTSPRMRGKLAEVKNAMTGGRNIPAYAGKTTCCSAVTSMPAEHPRVCGENMVVLNVQTVGNGTSPRMRGKRSDQVKGQHLSRNIPAYAGKTESQH